MIEWAGVGVTGVSDHPYRAHEVEAALVGTTGTADAVAAAAALVVGDREVNADIHAGREYRAAMAVGACPSCDRGGAGPRRLTDRVQVDRVTPGRRPPAGLAGAVLARDLVVAGDRWCKGRRLTAADLDQLAAAPAGEPVTVLVAAPGDVHEDEAGLRLAAAVSAGGEGLELRGPSQSRVDLVATVAGVVERAGGRPRSGSIASTRSRCSPSPTAGSWRPATWWRAPRWRRTWSPAMCWRRARRSRAAAGRSSASAPSVLSGSRSSSRSRCPSRRWPGSRPRSRPASRGWGPRSPASATCPTTPTR